MTERITTDWLPEQDLEALLDALTLELLASPDQEVSTHYHRDADRRHDEAETIRRLVAAAESGSALPAASLFKTPGLRAYFARNQ